MTSSASFHYILALTLLFASSFSVFHGSEHTGLGKAEYVSISFTASNYGHLHSESEHHDDHQQSHTLEPLCDVCLVLSTFTLYDVAYRYQNVSSEISKPRLINFQYANQKLFQTYLSRAPPRNA